MTGETERFPARRRRLPGRPAVLGERDFRWFFVGYATSLVGSSMAPVAVAFAVLDGGGGGSELGWVMAARILPIVLVMLFGGVVADRLGSRRVMLAADVLRCAVQGVFAVLLLTGHARLWAMVVLVAVWGLGEGVFLPSLGALVPSLVRREERLPDANTLLGLARSVSTVAGPALAGVITAGYGPGAVLVIDAVTYGVGALALARLSAAPPTAAGEKAMAGPGGREGSMVADLREGWSAFRSRRWLWVTTVQMGLFNLLVWAPFLVLGPLTAQRELGGARAWGLVMGVYGVGAVLGGLLMLGRRPGRPLAVATVATLGWALPSASLAAGLPLGWTVAATLVAGSGSAVCGSLYESTLQRWVPAEVLARVTAFGGLGAFVLGPLGLAAAGPLADRVGVAAVLAFGAGWQLLAAAAVLAVRAVRRRGWDGEPVADAGAVEPARSAAGAG
ncbi:MFS transporter [Kitasatospora purpeofusca]|uniref:MFS transporter n=1 Tax=Kitasatospora purpeofusca TaxID=67352 RepID=UPI00225C0E85|nr:MFS transporter [Kitasatospora purpeofusca]MCX4686280.1 MFS transporter [Kitasatospora purpeofusca]